MRQEPHARRLRSLLVDQSLDIQLEALSQAGCQKAFAEKVCAENVAGRSTTDREQLAAALNFVREGTRWW